MTELIEHPTFLAFTIVALALVNYGVGSATLRAESRQRVFERGGVARAPLRSRAAQLAMPFVTAVPIAALVRFLDPLPRELLGGGYLVMQLGTLTMTLDGLLRACVLSVPGVADGHVVLAAHTGVSEAR